MILIIFIVNASEFVYFLKLRKVTKGGSDCLCLLSPGAFHIDQFVTNCIG